VSVVRIVVSVLLGLLLLATGVGKIAGNSTSLGIRDALALSPGGWRAIGVFELAVTATLGIGLVATRVATTMGGVAVVVLMLGALAFRLRAGGEQLRVGVPVDVIVLALGALLVFAA
jgi:hypothetical protein